MTDTAAGPKPIKCGQCQQPMTVDEFFSDDHPCLTTSAASTYPTVCIHGDRWDECCSADPGMHVRCTQDKCVGPGARHHCAECGPRAPWPCGKALRDA